MGCFLDYGAKIIILYEMTKKKTDKIKKRGNNSPFYYYF